MAVPSIIDIQLNQDDRGFVYCALDNMDKAGIKRTYVVENLVVGRVRAWHAHSNGDTYMHVLSGICKLGALCIDDYTKITTKVLSDRKPQIFYIPKGYANGMVSLTQNTKILVYSTLSFDEVKNDDIRIDWNIIPDVWTVQNR